MPEFNRATITDATENQDLGQSEHDQAMIAASEGKPAPQQEASQEDRPEWLPEKFKTAEDMAASYAALEAKLGRDNASATEESAETSTEESAETSTEAAEEALNAIPEESFSRYSQEVADGGLTEDSYNELAKVGLPKAVVDSYIKGQQALQDATIKDVMSVVGTQEEFTKVGEWYKNNGDQAILSAYSASLESGDTEVTKGLLKTIHEAYKSATGVQGVRASGVPSNGNTSDVFRSQAELVAAMRDPRYKGNSRDEVYVRSVEAKLARSPI